jgi:predicted nucleic acid-binding protein
MIVADTSALISLTTAECLDLFLDEFDIHTTATVIDELEETAGYDDSHGKAATNILDNQNRLTVHTVENDVPETSRIDQGEGSCVVLADQRSADFLVTDDLRALPELQQLTDAQVAISPIVLKALVNRGVLEREEAVQRLEQLAETRDWLGAPIYRRAKQLFDDG